MPPPSELADSTISSCTSLKLDDTEEHDTDAENVVAEVFYSCEGLTLFDPQEFYLKYPFATHSFTDTRNPSFSEFVPVHGKIYSKECFEKRFSLSHSSKPLCSSCDSLSSLNSVKGMLNRADLQYEDNSNFRKINNHFLTPQQLIKKVQFQEKTISKLRLLSFNLQKKNNVLAHKVSHYERFLMALKENDVPRLKQLISVCVRQKRSIAYMVEKLNKAISGIYSPKGYTDFDNDLAAFVQIPRRPRLLYVLHQTSGLPSLSSEYRKVSDANVLKGLNITVTYNDTIPHVAEANVKKLMMDDDFSNNRTVKLWSLKVDELSVEGRLRYKSMTNEVLGMCCQHSKKSDVLFSNSHFVSNLEEGLEEKCLHLESCIFALSCLGKDGYHAPPSLSFPICSHMAYYKHTASHYAF